MDQKGMMLYTFHKWMIGCSIALLCFVNSVSKFLSMIPHASTYALLPGTMIWLASSAFFHQKILLPHGRGAVLFFAFLAICVCSDVVNINTIISNHDYEKNGPLRAITKLLPLILDFLFALYVYNFFRRYKGDVYSFFFRCLLVSFALASAYSFLELLRFIFPAAGDVVRIVDSVFRAEDGLYFKIRSLTYEASTLGNYLAIIFPVLFIRAMQKKKIYIVWMGFLFIMALGSFARTTYFLLAMELFVLMFFFGRRYFFRFWKLLLLTGILFAIGIEVFINTGSMAAWNPMEVFFSFTGDGGAQRITSNAMRFGTQIGAWDLFLDYPLLGVGIGQATFYLLDYVPEWIWMSVEMQAAQYNMPVYGVYLRLLSEVGIVGMTAYLWMWLDALRSAYVRIHDDTYPQRLAVFVGILGLVVAGFNWDLLSYPALWIYLGLSWYIHDDMTAKSKVQVPTVQPVAEGTK